jgi:hypothetical protein
VKAEKLTVLTMMGNPCAKIPGYRSYIIDTRPSIWALDELVVQDFERQEAASMYP